MQYFYKVANKVFLQEQEAVKYGRRTATIENRQLKLFRQPITKTGVMKLYKTLLPYETKN